MTYLRPPVIGNFKTTEKKPKSRAHRQDEGHLDFIRSLPCVVCRTDPAGVAHHLLSVPGTRGGALKAPDWLAVPLCGLCHDRLHAQVPKVIGELEWFSADGIRWVHELVHRLWRNSGDYEMACLIVEAHRDRRD